MDALNQIVQKLTKEEVRNFKLLYKARSSADERKDLVLFNYMRSRGIKFDENKALKRLGYAETDKNSYYRLKHRLTEDIGDSLVLQHVHKNEVYELLQFINLYYINSARNSYKTCLFYLRKAERLALNAESYELLDVVYTGFIRLSADLIEIDPAEYIKKREQNAVIISNLREMDDMLASLSYRLKVTQNFGTQDKSMLQHLQNKVRQISKVTTTGFSKGLEERIYRALSQVFLQQHNYPALEKLVLEAYLKFDKNKWFDKGNHELKLQMLTYCANALYKNRKYRESLEYAGKLGFEIEQFGRLHYDKYLFFYYNARVLNYAALDLPQALKALDELEKEMRKKKNNYYDFFIYLNRATVLYDMHRYKESLKNLVKLYLSDEYTKADDAFKLKIEICELIITLDSGETDSLDYRTEQVKKSFAALAKQSRFKRDFDIISLISSIHHSANSKQDAKIQALISRLRKAPSGSTGEEIIIYNDWLERKLQASR